MKTSEISEQTVYLDSFKACLNRPWNFTRRPVGDDKIWSENAYNQAKFLAKQMDRETFQAALACLELKKGSLPFMHDIQRELILENTHFNRIKDKVIRVFSSYFLFFTQLFE